MQHIGLSASWLVVLHGLHGYSVHPMYLATLRLLTIFTLCVLS
jgi:hypothetical protein